LENKASLTFSAFAEIWKERRGSQLVQPKDNEYRIAKISRFTEAGSSLPLGDKALRSITTDDIEAFRDARKASGL
jgi:hypothetical protein